MSWVSAHRIEVKYALIAGALLAAVVWLDRSGVLSIWAVALEPWIEELAGLGLAGAFVLGLLGNSSLLLQVPYTVPILSAALAGAALPYLLALAVAAGLGATAGELVSYAIANQLLRRPELSPSRLFRWVDRTVHDHPRAIPWLVFLFAVTVLPDDAVLIPLAMISYGAGRLLLPLLLGKLGYCVAIALVFHALGEQAAGLVPARTTTDLALLLVVGFVLLVLYQAEAARSRRRHAGSVMTTATQEGTHHGAQDPDRDSGGLRPRGDGRGRRGGHHADRGSR